MALEVLAVALCVLALAVVVVLLLAALADVVDPVRIVRRRAPHHPPATTRLRVR